MGGHLFKWSAFSVFAEGQRIYVVAHLRVPRRGTVDREGGGRKPARIRG